MKIWIGCDHAGYERKQEVIALLKERQLEVEDCGCNGERADYPVIAKAVGTAVASHPGDMGILICGTGIGMSIAANKIRGIRASLCADAFSTKYTRLHNDWAAVSHWNWWRFSWIRLLRAADTRTV